MVHSRTLPPRLQNTHAAATRAPLYTTTSSPLSVSTLPPPNPNMNASQQPWPMMNSSELFSAPSVASSGDPWAAPPLPTPTLTSEGPRTRRRSNTTAGLMRNNEGMPAVPVLPPRMRAVKAPRHQTSLSCPPSLMSLTPPPGLPLPPHLRSPLHANVISTPLSAFSHSSLSPEAPAFQPRSLLHAQPSVKSNEYPLVHSDSCTTKSSSTPTPTSCPPPPPAYLVEFMANKGASAQSKAVASALNDVTNTPVDTPTAKDLPKSKSTLPTSTVFLASLPPRHIRTPPPPCRIVADMLLNRVRVGGGYRPRRRLFPLSEHHRYVRSGLSREYRFDSRDASPRNSPMSSPRIRAVDLPSAVAA